MKEFLVVDSGNPVGRHLIRRIRGLLSLGWQVTFNHEYREANLVADGLAKLGYSITTDTQINLFPTPPTCIEHIIASDSHGVSTPRFVVASETVLVDEISYPSTITTTKPLSLLGHGITDMEIHFLQVKFYSIGVYLDPEIVSHLQQFKGKSAKELEENDEFFDALISAPVEKAIRIVVIKEIKGAQYGLQVETAVRDRLAADDKYEEEEEEALEKVVEFFQSKYFKKHSVITYHFPANSSTAEIAVSLEGKEDTKFVVENANVVETIKKWYLAGSRAVSPSTISSLANILSQELSK